MSKLAGWLLFFGLAAPGFADVVVFSGTFSADDQVALFNIVANASETITIQTYSYAGGTVAAKTFAAGGFAPTAFLFDNLGDVITLTNGTCARWEQIQSRGTATTCISRTRWARARSLWRWPYTITVLWIPT